VGSIRARIHATGRLDATARAHLWAALDRGMEYESSVATPIPRT
jgi:hypothetical protein